MNNRQVRKNRDARKTGAMTTRVLLVCGALAATQAMVSLATTPFTPAIAAAAPPVYAFVAGVHSVMPFLARRLTGVPWTATVTAGVTGLLMWPFTAVGPLILVAFLAGAASFDLVLVRAGASSRRRYLAAVAAASVALFIVSLPVFSPAHLVPLVLIGALAGRFLGEGVAAGIAILLQRGLFRTGLRSFQQ